MMVGSPNWAKSGQIHFAVQSKARSCRNHSSSRPWFESRWGCRCCGFSSDPPFMDQFFFLCVGEKGFFFAVHKKHSSQPKTELATFVKALRMLGWDNKTQKKRAKSTSSTQSFPRREFSTTPHVETCYMYYRYPESGHSSHVLLEEKMRVFFFFLFLQFFS